VDLEEGLRKAYRAWARREAKQRFVGGATEHAHRTHVEERMRYFPAFLLAVDTLSRSTVARTSLILSGSQPIPRVQLKCGRRRYTLEPYRLLPSALEVLMKLDGDDRWRFPVGVVSSEMEAVLEGPLAVVRADVANSVATALVDEDLTRPIREKLAKQRELARLNALQQCREMFRNVQALTSKEDVMQVWDEVLVAKVMDS